VKMPTSAPNTRSLIFADCGWARECAPFWTRSPRKGQRAKGAWVQVFKSVPGGVLIGSTGGGRGGPWLRRPRRIRPAESRLERIL
jgi:hypothetical protein